MPDPQYYSLNDNTRDYDLYRRQAQWVVDNRNAVNIQHVIWLGDLTNNNTNNQWLNALPAYSILDNAGVSYAVVPGNHDYMTNNSNAWRGAHLRNLNLFNAALGPYKFNTKPWYGGNMGETASNNENNYTYFSANGLDFMVVGLEYAPRKEVLTWANNLIAAHPNHRVILFTHAYMTSSGRYGGQAGSAAGTVGASGQEIFDECVSRHSNVFMIVCGHVTESVVKSNPGVAGNKIYEMLVDYQGEGPLNDTDRNLGNGWLRILTFDPANHRINASTVTPAVGDTKIFTGGVPVLYRGAYAKSPTHSDHKFTLDYNMGPMDPYTYLNDSLGFHTMGVGGDLHSDQLDPDMAQADNGNWATVWEDDRDVNGIYRLYVRGFDPDGNERFARRDVNAAGVNTINAVNPSMAMAPDGRFVITWQSGSTGIKYRTFAADGVPAGGEINVVSVTGGATVANPDVAIDNQGRFVITWSEDHDGDETYQVKARGFNFNGSLRFITKDVSVGAGQHLNPVIAMSGSGDYVVAWETDQDGTWDIAMRGYTAFETQRFAQSKANSIIQGEQRSPDVAMDSSGRFVVIWEDDNDLNTFYQLHSRGFEANGIEKFPTTTVNAESGGNQLKPAIAMDAIGNWYAAWEDNGIGGQGFQIVANKWDINGVRAADDAQINAVSSVTHAFGTPARKSPIISAHKSGRFVVGWADDMDGNGAYQALSRAMPGTAKSLVVKTLDGAVAQSPAQPFYGTNEQVTLTATAKPGYTFLRWTGDVPTASRTSNPVTITMNSNKKITAEYSISSAVAEWSLY